MDPPRGGNVISTPNFWIRVLGLFQPRSSRTRVSSIPGEPQFLSSMLYLCSVMGHLGATRKARKARRGAPGLFDRALSY